MGTQSAPARVGTQRVNRLTIVDTDILIDAARQISDAVDCLAQIERQSVLAVSVITQMELLVGCRNKAVIALPWRYGTIGKVGRERSLALNCSYKLSP